MMLNVSPRSQHDRMFMDISSTLATCRQHFCQVRENGGGQHVHFEAINVLGFLVTSKLKLPLALDYDTVTKYLKLYRVSIEDIDGIKGIIKQATIEVDEGSSSLFSNYYSYNEDIQFYTGMTFLREAQNVFDINLPKYLTLLQDASVMLKSYGIGSYVDDLLETGYVKYRRQIKTMTKPQMAFTETGHDSSPASSDFNEEISDSEGSRSSDVYL